jgi:hypothetical protein
MSRLEYFPCGVTAFKCGFMFNFYKYPVIFLVKLSGIGIWCGLGFGIEIKKTQAAKGYYVFHGIKYNRFMRKKESLLDWNPQNCINRHTDYQPEKTHSDKYAIL